MPYTLPTDARDSLHHPIGGWQHLPHRLACEGSKTQPMIPRTAAFTGLLTLAGLTACYFLWPAESPDPPDPTAGASLSAKHASPRSPSDPQSEAAAKLAARSDSPEGMQAFAAHLAAWSAVDERSALQWTHGWVTAHAAQSEARASGLLGELARNGASALALQIAQDLPDPLRGNMVELTLAIQAATAPLEAWGIATGITDEALRERTRLAVLTHGSDAQLPQLADFATQMPGHADALGGILKRWALQDPAALSEWLNAHAVAPEVKDLAASHLVLRGDSENRSTEVAAAWAESISDHGLRLEAIRAVTAELAASDLAAAHAYVTTAPSLSDEERAAILATLDAPR